MAKYIRVVLRLPGPIGKFLFHAKTVLSAIQDNPRFPNAALLTTTLAERIPALEKAMHGSAARRGAPRAKRCAMRWCTAPASTEPSVPLPNVVSAPASLKSTEPLRDLSALSRGGGLPFRPPSGPTPPGRGAAKTMAVLPFLVRPPGEAAAASPRLTLQQYVSLRGDLAEHPERERETLARYGVADEAAGRALDACWQAKLAASPALRAEHDEAVITYVRWLRGSGTLRICRSTARRAARGHVCCVSRRAFNHGYADGYAHVGAGRGRTPQKPEDFGAPAVGPSVALAISNDEQFSRPLDGPQPRKDDDHEAQRQDPGGGGDDGWLDGGDRLRRTRRW